MESIKSPSPTALALGALTVVWTEVLARRVSVWIGVKDTMEVMERRRTALVERGDARKVKAEPKPEKSEPRSFYERMRSPRKPSASGPTFVPSDEEWPF